jgi:hypothetical protein
MIICLWEITDVFKILGRNSAWKVPFVRPRKSLKNNIVIDVKEMGYKDMD